MTDKKIRYVSDDNEPLYTLSEAERIINRRYAKQAEIKRAERIINIKQKLLGLFIVALSIAIPFLLDGDATASIILFPLGIACFFTKEKFL